MPKATTANPWQEHEIRCVSRASGKQYSVWIKAPTVEQAEAQAEAEGHVVASAAALLDPKATPGASPIICPNPNCGYHGPARQEPRGSIVVGILLCMFFLIPGIFYFMLKSGYRLLCPRCGMQLANQN